MSRRCQTSGSGEHDAGRAAKRFHGPPCQNRRSLSGERYPAGHPKLAYPAREQASIAMGGRAARRGPCTLGQRRRTLCQLHPSHVSATIRVQWRNLRTERSESFAKRSWETRRAPALLEVRHPCHQARARLLRQGLCVRRIGTHGQAMEMARVSKQSVAIQRSDKSYG